MKNFWKYSQIVAAISVVASASLVANAAAKPAPPAACPAPMRKVYDCDSTTKAAAKNAIVGVFPKILVCEDGPRSGLVLVNMGGSQSLYMASKTPMATSTQYVIAESSQRLELTVVKGIVATTYKGNAIWSLTGPPAETYNETYICK